MMPSSDTARRVLTRRAAAEPHPAYGTGGRARAPGEHVFVPRQHRFDGAPAGVDVRAGAVPQVVSVLPTRPSPRFGEGADEQVVV